ncbi:MAG: hypothetical protein ABI083_16570, partial [Lapillicoccus sp.]
TADSRPATTTLRSAGQSWEATTRPAPRTASAPQPVEVGGKVSSYVVSDYVVSGFMNKKQLETLRELVDTDKYEKSSRWRGQYLEMARAIVSAIDGALLKKK